MSSRLPGDVERTWGTHATGAALATPDRGRRAGQGAHRHIDIMTSLIRWAMATSLTLVIIASVGCEADHAREEANGDTAAADAPAFDVHRADSALLSSMKDPRAWPIYGREYT